MWHNLLPHDKVTIFYIIVTVIITIAGSSCLENVPEHLLVKSAMFFFIIIITLMHKKWQNLSVSIIHNFYPLFFLGYFYAETGYLNNLILNDLDPFIKHYEQLLFGCQPSIEFSKLFPQTWFNELMNFGYFSYYFLTVTVCLTIFIVRPKEYQFTIFIIITSFFIYYIIFIIFPVIGPQFYFPAPLSKIPDAGFFRDGVKFAQHIGEQPTGAFPSSHVGMALIFLYISYNNYRKLFLLILPFVIILFFATVYIKAHYLVDVIGGFVSSPLVLFISIKMYKLFYKHEKA